MKMAPIISCIMPVYNCEKYIAEAIQSILQQTYSNFELIIIDDGSVDNTVTIINEFKDDRIQLVKKIKNSGIAESLNEGLEIAKGKYIARMDGDDISLPERFAKQFKFLENNPSIIAVGSSYNVIGSDKVVYHPTSTANVKSYLLSGCYIAHPSAFVRKEIFDKYFIRYDKEMVPAEDYWLWVKISDYGELANLHEPLIAYRIHDQQTSSQKIAIQDEKSDSCRLQMLYKLIEETKINDTIKSTHLHLMKNQLDVHLSLSKLNEWIKTLLKANVSSGIFNQASLQTFLGYRLDNYVNQYFLQNRNYSFGNILFITKNSGRFKPGFSPYQLIKICVRYFIEKAKVNLDKIKKRVFAWRISELINYYYQINFNNTIKGLIINYKQIPIVINNYNQLENLLLLIDTLQTRGYNNIFVLDNASTYPPLLDFYSKTNVSIIRLNENLGHMAFWLNNEVSEKFSNQYYIVTDPDVIIGPKCPTDFIITFFKVLLKYPKVTKVGCALCIDDLPDFFPLKNEVISWEKRYWQNKAFSNGYYAAIDTTFAIYRPDTVVNDNFYFSIRMAGKFMARHMGWYQDPGNLDDEQMFYKKTANNSASWTTDNSGKLRDSGIDYFQEN